MDPDHSQTGVCCGATFTSVRIFPEEGEEHGLSTKGWTSISLSREAGITISAARSYLHNKYLEGKLTKRKGRHPSYGCGLRDVCIYNGDVIGLRQELRRPS